ncbi:unnamed protein product, partial [Mesorhabditis spiculigera]
MEAISDFMIMVSTNTDLIHLKSRIIETAFNIPEEKRQPTMLRALNYYKNTYQRAVDEGIKSGAYRPSTPSNIIPKKMTFDVFTILSHKNWSDLCAYIVLHLLENPDFQEIWYTPNLCFYLAKYGGIGTEQVDRARRWVVFQNKIAMEERERQKPALLENLKAKAQENLKTFGKSFGLVTSASDSPAEASVSRPQTAEARDTSVPDFLCCTICTEAYDEELRRPLILSPCGHTFCATCLTERNIGVCWVCNQRIEGMLRNFEVQRAIDAHQGPNRPSLPVDQRREAQIEAPTPKPPSSPPLSVQKEDTAEQITAPASPPPPVPAPRVTKPTLSKKNSIDKPEATSDEVLEELLGGGKELNQRGIRLQPARVGQLCIVSFKSEEAAKQVIDTFHDKPYPNTQNVILNITYFKKKSVQPATPARPETGSKSRPSSPARSVSHQSERPANNQNRRRPSPTRSVSAGYAGAHRGSALPPAMLMTQMPLQFHPIAPSPYMHPLPNLESCGLPYYAMPSPVPLISRQLTPEVPAAKDEKKQEAAKNKKTTTEQNKEGAAHADPRKKDAAKTPRLDKSIICIRRLPSNVTPDGLITTFFGHDLNLKQENGRPKLYLVDNYYIKGTKIMVAYLTSEDLAAKTIKTWNWKSYPGDDQKLNVEYYASADMFNLISIFHNMELGGTKITFADPPGFDFTVQPNGLKSCKVRFATKNMASLIATYYKTANYPGTDHTYHSEFC